MADAIPDPRRRRSSPRRPRRARGRRWVHLGLRHKQHPPPGPGRAHRVRGRRVVGLLAAQQPAAALGRGGFGRLGRLGRAAGDGGHGGGRGGDLVARQRVAALQSAFTPGRSPGGRRGRGRGGGRGRPRGGNGVSGGCFAGGRRRRLWIGEQGLRSRGRRGPLPSRRRHGGRGLGTPLGTPAARRWLRKGCERGWQRGVSRLLSILACGSYRRNIIEISSISQNVTISFPPISAILHEVFEMFRKDLMQFSKFLETSNLYGAAHSECVV